MLSIQIDPLSQAPQTPPNQIFWAFGGVLSEWVVACPPSKTFKEHLRAMYSSEVEHLDGAYLGDQEYFCFKSAEGEEDEPLPPMIKFSRPTGETVLIYQHGFIAFVGGNDAPFIVRMD